MPNPREATDAEELTHIVSVGRITITSANGDTTSFVQKTRTSTPGPNGVYQETEETNFTLDDHNLAFDEKDFVGRSWDGGYIRRSDQIAQCSYWIHSRNLSRTVIIGRNGSFISKNRAICEQCRSRMNTIHIVLALICVGVGIAVAQAALIVIGG